MSRQQRESNPHLLPRHNDSIIEFPTQPPPPSSRSQPLTQPQHPLKSLPPHLVEAPPQLRQESGSRFTQGHNSQPMALIPSGRDPQMAQRRHQSVLRGPTSRRTKPVAWIVAAFCALFWIVVIVGGLIVLIVYLVFQPKSPRFDISTATLNAAYLDMGSLLNADMTLLANFTNPNTKVNVDFSYVVFDLYYERIFIASYYVTPFSARKRESRFANLHMVASQIKLSTGLSMELQRQMDNGRVNFEIKGLFRTRSKLGGIFRYSYWLYTHCEIEVTGPPTGVLIRKRCVTRR
ncbi:hypothetical protein OROGR_001536 [Orobanche gracilis]